MARIEKTVFISYRRSDVYTALAVYQDLSSKGYDVFFDYTSIPSGDFEQIIVSNIKGRAHFLLILTPTALDRCSEPGDWLRREIETAMDEQRNIIPLFFKGFKFGTPSVSEQLTGKLSDLGRYNGLNVHEDYFHAAMNRLSTQFLDVPLDIVLHPISREVRKVVTDEQSAVNDAIAEKWQEIKEFIKPTRGKESQGKGKPLSFRLYGIGAGILLAVVLGIAGINALLSNQPETTAVATTPAVINTVATQPSVTSSVDTATAGPGVVESDTPAPSIATATLTVTPSPTLGAGSTKISATDGMAMVYVPAGGFPMGSDKGEGDERPIHTVYLDAFWIDQTEVTNTMFIEYLKQNGNQSQDEVMWFKTDAANVRIHLDGATWKTDTGYENHPVVHVSWDGAAAYCSWAGRQLPTEAQWEKAARGADPASYPWPWTERFGEQIDCSFANYFRTPQKCEGKTTETTAVGSYPKGKSIYGVFDMAGNAAEWVNDYYRKDYYSIVGDDSLNPRGPENSVSRVRRGGSWNSFDYDLRTTDRQVSSPATASSTIGFRCAMSASE